MPTNRAKDHLKDHRKRLRARFLEAGEAGLADYELLELLLFGVLPRIDTKPVAKALIAEFGSLADVVTAPIDSLKAIDGLGETAAIHLKAVQAVRFRGDRHVLRSAPVIGSWSVLINYLQTQLAGERTEQVRVLFLDSKLRLQRDVRMGDGTVDHAPVYPREIAKKALELVSSSVIMVHNHPSGDPKPSAADIAMTREVIASLKAIDVTMHDHVIVGRDNTSSMKALGLI